MKTVLSFANSFGKDICRVSYWFRLRCWWASACILSAIGADLFLTLWMDMFRYNLAVLMFCLIASVNACGAVSDDVLREDYRYYQRLASAPQQIESQLHSDFQYLTAYGTALSKNQLLAYLAKSPQLVDQFDLPERDVWVNGDHAMVIGTAVTVGSDTKFTRVESRYWHLWMRVGDRWQLLLRQAELLTPKPDL